MNGLVKAGFAAVATLAAGAATAADLPTKKPAPAPVPVVLALALAHRTDRLRLGVEPRRQFGVWRPADASLLRELRQSARASRRGSHGHRAWHATARISSASDMFWSRIGGSGTVTSSKRAARGRPDPDRRLCDGFRRSTDSDRAAESRTLRHARRPRHVQRNEADPEDARPRLQPEHVGRQGLG